MNREDRKRQLIAQGAVYRAEVLLARQATEDSLRPDSLARSALQQAAIIGVSLFRNRNALGAAGIGLPTLLPLLMKGASALAQRKPLLKTVLRGLAVAGAVAGVAAITLRKKRSQEPAEDMQQ